MPASGFSDTETPGDSSSMGHMYRAHSTIRTFLLLLVVLCATSSEGRAQFLAGHFFSVRFDVSEYPTLSLDFYLLDSNGSRIVDLSASDLLLSESMRPVERFALSCPDPGSRDRLSSLLAIDISSSMSNNNRIEIARNAARAWIEELDLGYSEVALLAFDHEASLLHDFSTDRQSLLEALALLRPRGGTSYDAGLLSDPFGALPLVARGTQKRVVVFLTDGEATGEFSEMIDRARSEGITVHIVLLQTYAPPGLVRLARESGGYLFENVQDAEEARLIFHLLLDNSRGELPCRLTWSAPPGCEFPRDVNLTIPFYGVEWSGEYRPPVERLPALAGDSPHLAFGVQGGGSKSTMSLVLTAENDSVHIERFSLSSGAFSIVQSVPSLPTTLAPGEQITLQVLFQPIDSSYQFDHLAIVSDACFEPTVVASGGYPGYSSVDHLEIVSPNGGEVFHVGQNVDIVWSGVAANDTLLLEYSLDGGTSWRLIADNATGLRQPWSLPVETSERALVRGLQLTAAGERGWTRLPAPDRVWSVAWSSAREIVAIGSERGVVQLRNGADGALIEEFPSPDTSVVLTHLQFSPDGTEILLNSTGSVTYVRSLLDGRVRRITGSARIDRSVYATRDSSILSVSTLAGEIYRHDRSSFDLRATYPIDLTFAISELRYLDDLDLLLMAGGDDSVRAIRGGTSSVNALLGSRSRAVRSIDLSSDRTRFLLSGLASEIELFRWPDLTPLPPITTTAGVRVARFTRDGKNVLFPGSTRTVARRFGIELYDIDRQVSARELVGHQDLVTSLEVSPTSDRLLTGSWDSSAIMWDLSRIPSSEDESDNFFSIVDANLAIESVDFGPLPVGETRDLVVPGLLCNRGTIAITVDSLETMHDDFQVLSPSFPLMIEPGACIDIEVSYRPTDVGPDKTALRAYAGAYRVDGGLGGVGTVTDAKIIVTSIAFGEVEVGASRSLIESNAIQNISSDTLRIERLQPLQNDGQIYLQSEVLPITLPPGESIEVEYLFTPLRRGYIVDRLMVLYRDITPGSEAGVVSGSIVGEGICGEEGGSGIVRFPAEVHVAPGEDILVPITVERDHSVRRPDGRVMVLVSWDATLAALLGADGLERVRSGDRTFAIVRAEMRVDSDTLTTLRLIGGLGHALSTELTIHQIRFASECSDGFGAGEGVLMIDSICLDPEARLFHGSDSILLRPVVPHPVQSQATISFRLTESAPSTLELLDATGKRVRLLSHGKRPPGEHLEALDVAGLPSGRYYLRLRTDTQDLLTPVVIQE